MEYLEYFRAKTWKYFLKNLHTSSLFYHLSHIKPDGFEWFCLSALLHLVQNFPILSFQINYKINLKKENKIHEIKSISRQKWTIQVHLNPSSVGWAVPNTGYPFTFIEKESWLLAHKYKIQMQNITNTKCQNQFWQNSWPKEPLT